MLPLGKGVAEDLNSRLKFYRSDWTAINSNFPRVLAAATYIFFASAVPALAFGEQLSIETDGILNVVHVLAATSIAGVMQSVLGGQPLLIVGVAEPIVLIYAYMYEFAKDKSIGATCSQTTIDSIPDTCLFLPFAAWTCVWTALFMFILAFTNAASYINRFTRFSGELFGMLIALLFMQQAIKGVKLEFERPKEADDVGRLVNGLWSLFLAFGLCLSCLAVRRARSWRFLKGFIRSFLADYGVPVMVVAWSGLSFAVSLTGASSSDAYNIPTRVATPNTWQVTTTWTVASRMGDVPSQYIAGAIIPALIISILFYFDHSVSAQMAQQEEFNLKKPSAYHYDLFLVGIMSLLMGLVGLPPVNGVLPQAPLHTKSLSKLIYNKRLAAADDNNDTRRIKKQNTTNGTTLCQENLHVMQLEVLEQRGSNLLQSLAVGVCLAITTAIRQIPSAVLWGYFAYMAIESLPGNQFWNRLLLLFTDPKRRYVVLEKGHAPFLEAVPFRIIAVFTLVQLMLLMVVYGITWIPIAGVLFPLPIMLLVPFRQYIMPRMFKEEHLEELDAMQEEVVEPLPHDVAVRLTAGGEDTPVVLDEEIQGRRQMVPHYVTHDTLRRRRSISLEEEADIEDDVHGNSKGG